MTAGTWHHWEVLFDLSDLGQQNGVFKFWMDGILIMNYSTVWYIGPSDTQKFWNYKWNPTWGGTAGTRTRDDYIMVDHVYLSGLP